MGIGKVFSGLLKKERTPKKSPEPLSTQWGDAWKQMRAVSGGFERLDDMERQYQAAIDEGFGKLFLLMRQYSGSASALEKSMTSLYEKSCELEKHYVSLLQKLADMVDYNEQLTENKEALKPILEQIVKLLNSHGVTVYAPEEGKIADIKYCIIDIPVSSETEAPGTIHKVIAKGYIWNDKPLLRAKVEAAVESAGNTPAETPVKTKKSKKRAEDKADGKESADATPEEPSEKNEADAKEDAEEKRS